MAILEQVQIPSNDMSQPTPPRLEVVRDATDIIKTYEYPHYGMRVEVVGPDDYRLMRAIKLEVASMSDLGDNPKEVYEEFLPYRRHSDYYLTFALDAEGNKDNMLGMGRTISSTQVGEIPHDPYEWDQSERPYGNKSLIDLAKIEDWSLPFIAEYTPKDEDDLFAHDPKEIVDTYNERYDCVSLDFARDISILAPKLKLQESVNSAVGAALMASFTRDTLKEWADDKLTHIISFNEVKANAAFARHHFPFKKLFGLPPMQYDSFHTKDGMRAQISHLRAEMLAKNVAMAPEQGWKLLGSIALLPDVQEALKYAPSR